MMNLDIPKSLHEITANSLSTQQWITQLQPMLNDWLEHFDVSEWEQVPSDASVIIKAKSNVAGILYFKARIPDEEAIASISSFQNNDFPQLAKCIHSDVKTGIQVLRGVIGEPIAPTEDRPDALSKIGILLRELHTLNISPGMIPLDRWCHDLIAAERRLPCSISINIPRCNSLLNSAKTNVWLHGDLHHQNIIRNKATGLLTAIDPSGVYGDASFDICTFVRNHVPEDLDDEDLRSFLERRIRIIADGADYPIDRAFAWAAAGNALSIVWDLPASGALESPQLQHLDRILTQLNTLADAYGID